MVRKPLLSEKADITVLCHRCGETLSGWTETGGGRRPRPGDAAVCLYCDNVMMFDDRLRPVPVPPGRVEEFNSNPAVRELIRLSREARIDRAVRDAGRRPTKH